MGFTVGYSNSHNYWTGYKHIRHNYYQVSCYEHVRYSSCNISIFLSAICIVIKSIILGDYRKKIPVIIHLPTARN